MLQLDHSPMCSITFYFQTILFLISKYSYIRREITFEKYVLNVLGIFMYLNQLEIVCGADATKKSRETIGW
jgi:hypothetical protein